MANNFDANWGRSGKPSVIQASDGASVVGNTCRQNGFGAGDGAGVHATGSGNRIEGNNVTGNDRGIEVDVSGNVIIKNTASGNTNNYSTIAAGNFVGTIVTTEATMNAAPNGLVNVVF